LDVYIEVKNHKFLTRMENIMLGLSFFVMQIFSIDHTCSWWNL